MNRKRKVDLYVRYGHESSRMVRDETRRSEL